MSVKLRFVRVGKKNRPAYRLCAIESRRARDGAYLENIGFYDPYIADSKKIRIDKERAAYWLSVGAIPSQTVLDFFKKEKVSGLIRNKPKRKRRKKTARAGAGAGAPGVTAAAPAGAGGKPAKKAKPPKKPKPAKKSEAPAQ